MKIKYISLANIILNKKIIPELIQSDFSYKKFNFELTNLIFNKKIINNQLKMFDRLNQLLTSNGSSIAVKEIEKIIKNN